MDRHDTHLLSCSSSVEHSYKFDKSGNIISDSVSDMLAFSKASNKKKYKISDIFENLNKDNTNIIQEEDINNNNTEKEIIINKNNYKIKEINISNNNIGKDKDKDKKLINTNKNKFVINKDEKNIEKNLENNTNFDDDKKTDDDNMKNQSNLNGNKNILSNKDNNMSFSQIIKDQNENESIKDDNRKGKNKEKKENSKVLNEIGEENETQIDGNKNYTKNESTKKINNNGNNYKVIQSNETFMYSPYEKGSIKYKIKFNEIKENSENKNQKENTNNNSFNHNIIRKEAEYTYSLKKYDNKILKEINVSFFTLKLTKSKTKYIKNNKDKDNEKQKDEEEDNNKKESNNLAKENLQEYKYDAKYMERMKFSSKTSPFLSSINNMVKEKEMVIEKTEIEKYIKLPLNNFCYMIKSPMIINYKKSLSNVTNKFYFVSKEVISMEKYKSKIMNIYSNNFANNKKVKESIMFDQFNNNKGNLNKVIKDKFKLNNNNDKEDENKFIIDETEENIFNNKNNISSQNNDCIEKNMKEKKSIIRKKDNNEYNKDADDLSFINKNMKNKNKINKKENDNNIDDEDDDNSNVSKEENNLLNNNKINATDKENLIENSNVDKDDNTYIGNLDGTQNLRNKNNINNNRLLNNNFENSDNNNEDKFDEYSEIKNILEKYQNDNNFNIKNNNMDISNLNDNQTQINNIKKKNLLSPKKIIQKSNNNTLKPITNIKNNMHKVPNSAYLTPLTKNKNSNTSHKYNKINDTTNKISRITSPLTINNIHIRERRLFNDSNLPNVKKLKFDEKKNKNRSLINILNHKGIENDYSPSHKKENSPQQYCIHLEEELKSNSKTKYKRHFRNEQNCPICVALQLKNKLLEEKTKLLPVLTKGNFRKVCDHYYEHGNKSPYKEIMKTIYPRNKERSLIRVGSGNNVLTTRKKDKRRNESVKQIRRIEITNKLLNEQENNSKEKFPVIKDYFNINNL